jgi:hypothetical protein
MFPGNIGSGVLQKPHSSCPRQAMMVTRAEESRIFHLSGLGRPIFPLHRFSAEVYSIGAFSEKTSLITGKF